MVTRELSDEDWLSRGSLSNMSRSISVCVVDVVSIKSSPASTVSVCVSVPMARLIFNSKGTPDRILMSSVPA